MADDKRIVFRSKKYPSKNTPYYRGTIEAWPYYPGRSNAAAEVIFEYYLMRTPSTNAGVIVLQHEREYNQPNEDNYYDCMNFALGCWPHFGYSIQAGSIWDVVNDPTLASKIIDNEPTITPGRTSQLAADNQAERQSILEHVYPAAPADPARPHAGDIIVYWSVVPMGEHQYLRAMHAAIITEPKFSPDSKLLLESKVRTKNGNEAPKDSTLKELCDVYALNDLKTTRPAGIYRLVSFRFFQIDLRMAIHGVVFFF